MARAQPLFPTSELRKLLAPKTLRVFGGLNATADRNLLPAHSTTVLKNIELRDGTLRKCGGSSLWATLAPSNGPCRGVFLHHRPGGTNTILAVANNAGNGQVYRQQNPSGQAITLSPLTGNLSATASVEAVSLHKMVYLTDQSNLWLYDGELDTLAKYAPLYSPSAATNIPTVKGGFEGVIDYTTSLTPWLFSFNGTVGSTRLTETIVDRYTSLLGGSGSGVQSGRKSILVGINPPSPVAAESNDVTRCYVYNASNTYNLTSLAYLTNAVHFELFFDAAYWAAINQGQRTTVYACLWNGDPNLTSTTEVSVPITNIIKGEWTLATVTSGDALIQTGSTTFWTAVKGFGIKVVNEFPATSPQSIAFHIGGIFLPGLMYDQVSPLQVGYTYYDDVNLIESGISPLAAVDLSDSKATGLFSSDFAPWGIIEARIPAYAGPAPTPPKVRWYVLDSLGTWRLVLTDTYAQASGATGSTINVVLAQTPIGRFPIWGSTVTFTPTHLARHEIGSRLVALGGTDSNGSYPERVWISAWVDPLIGKGIYFPPVTPAGLPLTGDPNPPEDNGLLFDIPGSQELLAGRSLGGFFYIFSRGGIYRLVGTDATDFAVQRVNNAQPCKCAGSVVEASDSSGGFLIYLDDQNVFRRFRGETSEQLEGGALPPSLKAILDGLSGNTEDLLRSAQATWGDGRYLFSLPSAAGRAGFLWDSWTGAWSELPDFHFSRGVFGVPGSSASDPQYLSQVLVGNLDTAGGTASIVRLLNPGVMDAEGSSRLFSFRTPVIPVCDDTHQVLLRLLFITWYCPTPDPAGSAPVTVTVWDELSNPDTDPWFYQNTFEPTGQLSKETIRVPLDLQWLRGLQVQVAHTATYDFRVSELTIVPMSIRNRTQV